MKECKKIVNYFSEFLQTEKEKGLSNTTLKQRERHLDHFEKWLSLNNLKDITPDKFSEDILIKYKKFLKNRKSSRGKQISKQTQKNYMRTVRFFLEFLSNKDISCPSPEKARIEKKMESDVQKLVNYYFKTKGLSIEEVKQSARKKQIIYSRHTKPAKDLLDLAGSLEKAKKAIQKVADWAKSRNLDYAIETVFKKWPELKNLKPKKKEKKPFYRGERMIKSRGKWYVIDDQGEWFEFAGKEEDITWKEED
ncbi:MAG: phage integrase SAM-like domain-containing protein [Patescibacteria group bacterium]